MCASAHPCASPLRGGSRLREQHTQGWDDDRDDDDSYDLEDSFVVGEEEEEEDEEGASGQEAQGGARWLSPALARGAAAVVLVCALSGVALGTDLALPGALLAGTIAAEGDQGQPRRWVCGRH